MFKEHSLLVESTDPNIDSYQNCYSNNSLKSRQEGRKSADLKEDAYDTGMFGLKNQDSSGKFQRNASIVDSNMEYGNTYNLSANKIEYYATDGVAVPFVSNSSTGKLSRHPEYKALSVSRSTN